MATYITRSEITPRDLAAAADPDELIKATEEAVRVTLQGTSPDPGGETVLGWMARIPGIVALVPGDPVTAPRFVSWDPDTEVVPDGADTLSCRGRRTT